MREAQYSTAPEPMVVDDYHVEPMVIDDYPDVDRLCGGCRLTVENVPNGGLAVAFGNALWHVKCFICTKCSKRVTADTNLLKLSDGSPVCTSCSYNCHICTKPILGEAIMTGDESYHATCFTCKTCQRPIEELVFAKTSAGIYCMACHHERVARSKLRAEEKKRAKKDKLRVSKDPMSLDSDNNAVHTPR